MFLATKRCLNFLILVQGLSYGLSKSKKRGKIITKFGKTISPGAKIKNLGHRFADLAIFRSAKTVSVYRN